MKLTTLILLGVSLQIAAKGVGQDKVSLSFKKTEIAEILTAIEKQTNYRFLYNNELKNMRQKASVNVQNATLDEVMQTLLHNTNLVYRAMSNKLVVINVSSSYTDSLHSIKRIITGKVTDEEGKALSGVSVQIKGGEKGAATNESGIFSINAEKRDVLVFSYVGYDTQEIQAGDKMEINITLKPEKSNLDEIVVVGYGTVKKKDLTGSIVSLKGDEVKKIPAANLLESVQGKLPGVDITRSSGAAGAGVNIKVRGTRSLTASNNPLFIVDGIQYNSIEDINSNDIQSMEVLKDASSTAVYGSRGANGVIIVTTKKGTTGKPKIFLNSYYGINKLTDYPSVQDGPAYVAMKREANKGVLWNSPADDPKIFTTSELNNYNKGIWTNYQDLLLHTGIQQEHNAGVAAGSEKTRVYFSMNYFNEKGILKLNELRRYTARLNIDQTFGRIAKAGMQAQVTYYDQDNRDDPFNMANKIAPLTPAFDSTGKLIVFPNNGKDVSPLADEQPNQFKNNILTTRTLATAYAEITPFKGFSFRSNLGVLFNNSRTGLYRSPNTIGQNNSASLASMSTSAGRELTWENILNYATEIKEHSIAITGVTSFLEKLSDNVTAQGRNQLLSSQLYYGLGNAPEGIGISSGYSKQHLVSFTGRVNYGFKGRYLLTLAGRADGSSKLGTGNKWDFFPSAAVAWRIIDEGFMKDVRALSDLKIRVSYGVTGSDAIDPYSTQSLLYRIPFSYGETSAPGFAFQSRIGNPLLGWERTASFNLGLDMAFLDNRIVASVDAYDSRTSDLLQDKQLPPSSGVQRVVQNIGETRNKGIDVSLTTQNIRGKDLRWTTTFTFFANKERIVSLATLSNDVANGWFIGSPVNVFYDYRKIGIWQTKDAAEAASYGYTPGDIRVADIDNNKKITATDDRTIVGQASPKWNGGFNSDLSYKGFDLNVFVFARIGQTIKYEYLTRFDPQGVENSGIFDYWTADNATNDYPQPKAKYSPNSLPFASTLGYIDGSFVKIRSLTLGYTLPQSLTRRWFMNSVRFYATGKNLFSFSKLDNYDPERGGALSNPLTKIILFGANIEF